MSFVGYIFAFLLGLAFIPLVVLVVIFKLPEYEGTDVEVPEKREEKEETLKVGEIEEEGTTGVKAYKSSWLTVTQEYLQSLDELSSNAQPIGDSIEGKTAYSSLYKLVRNPDSENANVPDISTADSRGGSIKTSQKKHRFYGVLKHGNLFLYKNETLKEVKQVFVVSNFIVTMWPRNVPDGQLFTKSSAICLIKKDWMRRRRPSDNVDRETFTVKDVISENLAPPVGSVFIYCDNKMEKEDWYFSLIKATKLDNDVSPMSTSVHANALHFETKDVIELIHTLYASESQLHTQWLNALVGRIFLSFQKSEFLKDYLTQLLSKKINRVSKPDFLDTYKVINVESGLAAPFITWPTLKQLNPNGELLLGIFFQYSGRMSFRIATKAVIGIGSRFKAREVDLLLAITIERVEGPMLIKMKPPPSNRLWYTFEREPVINLQIEPVISSKQITYNIVTYTIERKIKEAVKDSLVYPNWDDLAFYDTSDQIYRGGIWKKEQVYSNTDKDGSQCNKKEQRKHSQSEASDEGDQNSALSVLGTLNSSTVKPSISAVESKSKASPTDFSKKLRKSKSNVTLGLSEDHCLSDGSIMDSSAPTEVLENPERYKLNKSSTLDTIKKFGKWYFKDPPSNEQSHSRPEMILNRKGRRSNGNDVDSIQEGSSTSYEMFNKDKNSEVMGNNMTFSRVKGIQKDKPYSKSGNFNVSKSPSTKTVLPSITSEQMYPNNDLFGPDYEVSTFENVYDSSSMEENITGLNKNGHNQERPQQKPSRKPPPPELPTSKPPFQFQSTEDGKTFLSPLSSSLDRSNEKTSAFSNEL